jgi:hypothetical protein
VYNKDSIKGIVLKRRGDSVTETTKQAQGVKAKRTTKNSVFMDLFQDKKNLLKLYQTLHPEDTSATEDMIDIVTLETVLTDNIYNDLGFRVGDRLLLLVEAQSTWTVNILVRTLLYLAQSYHEYFLSTKQSLYRSKKVRMPKPEIYVIYTGERGNKPEIISLSEEFFSGADIDVEIRAKVIYESDTKDIINQYIIFCKVFDEQRELYGLTEQAIRETVRICQDRDVLKEYLKNKEKEIVTIMMNLFDEEQIKMIYIKDTARDMAKDMAKDMVKDIAKDIAKEAVEKNTKEVTRKKALLMLQKRKITIDEIGEFFPELSEKEIQEIEAEVMQLS